jgi:type I restriction enzyme, S subunit
MSSWKTVRLGDVAKTSSGGTPKRGVAAYYGGDIPWVKSGELGDSTVYETQEKISKAGLDNSSAKLFPKGTLCVALYGATVGKLGILGMDAATNQAVCGIFLPDEIDTRFAYRFLESKRRELIEMGKGGAQSNISQEIIRDLQFPFPEPDEQRRIVAEIEKQFTRLEAGVAALRRVQANLKRYRAAVLKAACEGKLVSTEAELAKKENRKSKFETGEALLARILTERRQNWQGRGSFVEPAEPDTTILPKLPQGWTWATVEQLSNVVRGASPRPAGDPRFFGGNVPWITVSPLTADNSPYLKSVPASLNELGREHSRFIEPQTLLLTNSGATLGVPKISLIGGCINDGVAALMDVGYPLKLYLLYFLRTQTERLRGLNQGAAQPNLNTTIIKAINVPLPPLAEQTRIVAEVERRLSVVEELETVVSANLQRATRLRQSILHKAFSGELVATVPTIQISDIIPPLKPEHVNRPNSHFARAVLSAEIVHRLHRESTFGRIKHQKIFHLCEHIAQIEEINGQYHREAAGPLDNKLIYANEAELKKQKWYQEVRRESYGHAYQALDKAGGHRKYVERYWADKLPTIEKLIELMRKWDTERCEIFCTAYAAWNDLILWGKQATEDNILHEILERWHDSKKRFPKERWLKAIGWMKKEGFVPTGFGKPTKEAK